MTTEERMRKQTLHEEIKKVLLKVETDEEYFQNLVWALEIISNELSRWP